MVEKFLIIRVPSDVSQYTEEIGTREKFWFRNEEGRLYLYKKIRYNTLNNGTEKIPTGEDWAEKIASELCEMLELPHAEYHLATSDGERGVITPSFLPEQASLIAGNEILSGLLPDYPINQKYGVFQHTINNVFNAIKHNSVNLPINWIPLKGISNAEETFVGYLLLDAWVGNSDRHHENWAFVSLNGLTYLAPTYDHASCLGRNESDEKRKQRLITKDTGFSVQAYVTNCKSALYAKDSDKKPLKTFDAFCEALQRYPNAARVWLNHLDKVSNNDILKLFQRIPTVIISETAIEFALKILEINQSRLLKLRKTLP
ncbi:HipA-like protein [Scytonema hofmannii PCC 7110]|uniref:HipA-like protein n=1 Tax=Scytonema hofmannii PCC 7110 TaxID=128403 RepID=A0A139WUB4_9CYAN|nr:HipA domain-containing protein [Scytonema hofmannii]KYC36035.1 HipA-like protein [Scytonema hofmannii PCC 7110]